MARIFICYRRDDSGPAAGRLYDRLERHFERGQVFMDVDDIPFGVDWRDWLDHQIRQCDLVLVVMGQAWLSATDAKGQRRLDAPRDFVRTEIEIALERQIPLIPVLLEGAEMPEEDALPPSIAPLAYRQAATVHAAGRHFRGHVEQLIRGIEWHLGQRPDSSTPRDTEQNTDSTNGRVSGEYGPDNAALANHGITTSQQRALAHLRSKGRLTLHDYATVTEVSRQTALRGIEDLLTRGLIVRRGSARDVHYVAATPDGPQCASQVGAEDETESGKRRPVGNEEAPSSSPEVRTLLTEIAAPATAPPRRLAIGDRLAELGDPRPGVGLRPDGLPDIDWVEVPRGPFVYQAGKTRELPTVWIARYPVTNAQYQAFMDDGGYAEPRWWQGLKRPQPQVPRWTQPNRPRTDVDWYEAVAFGRWLDARLGSLRGLAPGSIRLPTEREWEKAARGEQGWAYPWGNDYRSGFANVDETDTSAGRKKAGPWYLEQTTAVGLYPQGHSPYGAADMAGTVWEWCLNRYDDPEQTEADASGASRALRGGSWLYHPALARAVIRPWSPPEYRYAYRGFRLLSSVPIEPVR